MAQYFVRYVRGDNSPRVHGNTPCVRLEERLPDRAPLFMQLAKQFSGGYAYARREDGDVFAFYSADDQLIARRTLQLVPIETAGPIEDVLVDGGDGRWFAGAVAGPIP